MANNTEVPVTLTCTLCEHVALPYFSKHGYQYARCSSCAFVFVTPLPDTSIVYQDSYFSGASHGFGYVDYDSDKEAMRSTFEKYLELAETELPQKGTLLDIGAATGFFMSIAQNMGWEVRGIEISPYAAKLAGAKGLTVLAGTIDSHSTEHTYDAITMLDVLEHVDSPRETLQKAFGLLKHGGVLVINTPDTGSVIARLLTSLWHQYIPPEHIALFNEKNISSLLKETGFTVLNIQHIGKRFTLRYMIETLNHHVRIPLLSTILEKVKESKTLGGLWVPLNLYDNMTILAKKV